MRFPVFPLFPLFPVMLLSACAALVDGVLLTFQHTDPTTGKQVECDRCPPGTYLRARCTATQKSVCAPCPPGSFTELWNHIGKCLRCGVCGHNQLTRAECTARSDCQCECKPGFYYKKVYEMCLQHSDCPPGHGVLSRGTAHEDTVCHVCPNGTFSDLVSAQQNCTEHKSCGAGGRELLLKGSTWHDSVCTSCQVPRDGGSYLKEILPAFFQHQKMSVKRLRRIVHILLAEDGKKQRASELNLSELHAFVDNWVASATAKQIRKLPEILMKAGAAGASERLHNKLHRIDSNLNMLCVSGNEVDVVLLSE